MALINVKEDENLFSKVCFSEELQKHVLGVSYFVEEWVWRFYEITESEYQTFGKGYFENLALRDAYDKAEYKHPKFLCSGIAKENTQEQSDLYKKITS